MKPYFVVAVRRMLAPVCPHWAEELYQGQGPHQGARRRGPGRQGRGCRHHRRQDHPQDHRGARSPREHRRKLSSSLQRAERGGGVSSSPAPFLIVVEGVLVLDGGLGVVLGGDQVVVRGIVLAGCRCR